MTWNFLEWFNYSSSILLPHALLLCSILFYVKMVAGLWKIVDVSLVLEENVDGFVLLFD